MLADIKLMKGKFKPGSPGKAYYSEVNFRLLGKALEVITQKSIQDLLTALFQDLSMNNTFVLDPSSLEKCAPIYHQQKHLSLASYWASTQQDVCSTAEDQMKFIRAFFTGDYISKDTLESLGQWNRIFFLFNMG